jgi:hypothetical protein
VAREDTPGDYVTLGDRPLEHQGTDTEALATAVRLQEEHAPALHVEAVSVGRPQDVTETPGRLVVRIQERQDAQGWTLSGDMMPTLWYGKLTHAVGYAACRARGYVIEMRLVNRSGEVTHVVLVDTTKSPAASPFLGGPGLGRQS